MAPYPAAFLPIRRRWGSAEAAAEPTLTVDLPLRSDQDIGLPPSKIPQTAKAAGLRTNFAPRAFVVRDARFMLPVLEGETGKVF